MLDPANWNAVGVSIQSNYELAPDGVTESIALTENASGGAHQVNQGVATDPNVHAYAAQVSAKAIDRTLLEFGINASFQGNATALMRGVFDLSTGAQVSLLTSAAAGIGNASATLVDEGNGYWTVTVNYTDSLAKPGARALYVEFPPSATQLSTWTGNGSDAGAIWKADFGPQ